MMRSPEDICCISLPIRAALAFMAPRIMAVVWASVMRIILQLPCSIGQTDSGRCHQVRKQLIGSRDHLHVGLVGLMVGPQGERLFIQVYCTEIGRAHV